MSSAMTLQVARQLLNITVDLIPNGSSNRPGESLTPTKVTIHNTGNGSGGADARMHAVYQKGEDARRREVSWHFTVDDHSVYQSLPVNEVGWHAGSKSGNRSSIGIEICEHAGIDEEAANDRAALLAAVQLRELGIEVTNVVQHHDWSGKDCPSRLRHPPQKWNSFLTKVQEYYSQLSLDLHEHDHRPTPVTL